MAGNHAPRLRQRMLCGPEEKKAHPLSLSPARCFADSLDEGRRIECNGFLCCERAERGACT